jgi:hypothetical protein
MGLRTTQTKTEETELKFQSLNGVGESLDFLEASSPAELLAMIRKIRLPTKIVSIYRNGSQHIAWIQTEAKLIKKGK